MAIKIKLDKTKNKDVVIVGCENDGIVLGDTYFADPKMKDAEIEAYIKTDLAKKGYKI